MWNGFDQAALTYHPISDLSFPLKVSYDFFNENRNGSGCHPSHGGVGLRNGTSWTNPSLEFSSLYANRILSILGVETNIVLQLGRWYRVEITLNKTGGQFIANATVIDDIGFSQSDSVTRNVSDWGSSDFDPTTFSHFELNAQENTVWFDNIELHNLE